MKILELLIEKEEAKKIGQIPIIRTKRGPFKDFIFPPEQAGSRSNRNKQLERIGRGIFARVFGYRVPRNTVIKFAKLSNDPEDDMFVRFINLVLKHQNNPFFPRIYGAKIYEYPDSTYMADPNDMQYVLFLNMERLLPLTDPKIVHMSVPLFAQIGVDQSYSDLLQTKDIKNLRDAMHDKEFREQLVHASKNPQFREAMTLLEPLISGELQDMHTGNWMVRLTGSGPQLVITDPVMSWKPHMY